MCSETDTGALSYDKFSFIKNSDKCTLEFTATHKAGCGTTKSSGFVQFLSSWFSAVILIPVGIVIWYNGGRLDDWMDFGFAVFIGFYLAGIALSNIGIFSVLEEDNETTRSGIIKAIVGFIITTVAAIATGKLSIFL